MKEEKKHTVEKILQEKKQEVELDESFDLCNCASSCDCTGAVPAAPASDEEWDAYDEIYHFQPKPVPKKQ